jgi:histidinol-phosphate aminotransferase
MSWREALRPAIGAGAAFRPFDYASAGPGLVRLDCNESAFPPGPDELAAFHEELARLDLRRYPDVSGAPQREALARRWGVAPDEIMLGSGSEEIISILTIAFGGRAGAPAAVLYPAPTFNQYEVLARAYGATPVAVPLGPGFRLDAEASRRVIEQARPALAFFASPNNPTGNRFEPDLLLELAQRMEGVFVVDEAYADFGGATLLPRVRDTPGLFVMRSLSKVGLAGLRVGALVGPREAIAEIDKVRLPWNVNAVSIALACATLRHPQSFEARIRETVALREGLAAALRAIPGVVVHPSDTNFLLVRVPEEATAVFQGLLARGVLVKNVAAPGPLERCLRITVGTEVENLRCARALRAALDEAAAHGGHRTVASRAAPGAEGGGG